MSQYIHCFPQTNFFKIKVSKQILWYIMVVVPSAVSFFWMVSLSQMAPVAGQFHNLLGQLCASRDPLFYWFSIYVSFNPRIWSGFYFKICCQFPKCYIKKYIHLITLETYDALTVLSTNPTDCIKHLLSPLVHGTYTEVDWGLNPM